MSDESQHLWEVYQQTGNYEDLCRWLKHQAYERIEYEIWKDVMSKVFDNKLIPFRN